MEHKLNVEQLYNVPVLLTNILVHVTLSFNTNLSKYVSFVNSNVSVLVKLVHNLTFNNMVADFSMLPPFFNKLVVLVSSKISHPQLVLVVLLSASVQQPMVNKMLVVSVEHQAFKAAASVPMLVSVAVLDSMLVLVVELVELHPSNHQASHHLVDSVEMPALVFLVVLTLVVLAMERHHLHSNQAAHMAVVLAVVMAVVLVAALDSMLLVPFSVASIPTMMVASIVRNSTVSSNKVYKKTIQITIKKKTEAEKRSHSSSSLSFFYHM